MTDTPNNYDDVTTASNTFQDDTPMEVDTPASQRGDDVAQSPDDPTTPARSEAYDDDDDDDDDDGGGGGGGKISVTNGKKSITPKKRNKKVEIPYTQFVDDAIVAMKNRNGSSAIAIQKWIMDQHPELELAKLKSRLNQTLKTGVKTGRFIKLKNSFKINPSSKKKKQETAIARKKRELQQKKEKQAKVKAAEKKVSKIEQAKIKAQEAEEAKARELKEKIKRRRFPMDDLKLREEDKELGVTVKLPAAPKLELALSDGVDRSACRSDTTRQGLMDHALHIYHFFRGDVGWGRFQKQRAIVAPFTLHQWLECVQLVSKGWARKSRMVPPLMVHLFVVALQHVCPPMLQAALNAASFAEILVLYMDAANEYFRTNKDQTALTHLEKSDGIDTAFLFGATDTEMDPESLEKPAAAQNHLYLGDGALAKAHAKLLNHNDPWILNAEELLTLLAALVDDVLATSTDCADEFDSRIEATSEQLKQKRAADAKYRKLQTARNKELADEKKDLKSADGAKLTRSNVTLSKISDAQLEKARKEQQKAYDAWDKGYRSKRIRLEPIGLDRNYSEVYHSWNDPQRAFVVKRGNKLPSEAPIKLPDDSQIYRMTWHTIDKKSTMDKYMNSLDVRGKRERALHEALERVSRQIYDDVKEANSQKSKLKEKEDLRRRLETARSKFENSRKSNRLVSQSEQELIDLETEISALEESIANGQVQKPYDVEVETGVVMLRQFDAEEEQLQAKRASRRDAKQQQQELDEAKISKLQCSRLWPSGHIDGTGIVGMIVHDLLELEERVEKLAPWECGDRRAWASKLESAINQWNDSSPPLESKESKPATPTSPDANANGNSHRGTSSPYKSPEPTRAYVKPSHILGMIKQPAMLLEQRIFEATGLSVVLKDADIADDNMSKNDDDEEERMLNEWKKIVNRLTRMPAKEGRKIKKIVLAAIAAARQAHNLEALNGLREALMEHRPDGAGLCQKMALDVLEKQGGYDDQFDDDDEDEKDDEEDKEEADEEEDDLAEDDSKAEGISSSLSAEAVYLNSSLDGHEDAGRENWIESVRSAKTLSKLSALVHAFITKASERLDKMEAEHEVLKESIEAWRKGNTLKKKKSGIVGEPSEVWANVHYTDGFCLVKVQDWPIWPARKCRPKDENLASPLASLDRVLVSLVGESGSLRVVTTDALLPFSTTLPEGTDLSMYSRDIRNQLDESMAVARRVVRGLTKKKK